MTDARSLIARFRNEKPKPRAERDYMRTAGNVQETWWTEGGVPRNSDPGRPFRHDNSSHNGGYRGGSAKSASSALRPVGELHTRTAPLVGRDSASDAQPYAASNRFGSEGCGFAASQGYDEYEDGFDRGYDRLQPSQRQQARGVGRNQNSSTNMHGGNNDFRGSDDALGQSGFSAIDDLVFGDVQRLETVTTRTTREHFTMPPSNASDDDVDSLDGRNAGVYSPPRASSTMQQQQTVHSATRFRFTPSSQPTAVHPPGTRPRPLALHHSANLPGYHHGPNSDGYEDEQSWEHKSAALSHARRPVHAVSAGMLRGSAGLTSGAQIPSESSGDSKNDQSGAEKSNGDGGGGDDDDDAAGQSVDPSAYDVSAMLDSTLALLQERLNGGGGGDSHNGGLSLPSYGGGGGNMGGFDGDDDELPQSISAIREKLESGMLCFNLLYEKKVGQSSLLLSIRTVQLFELRRTQMYLIACYTLTVTNINEAPTS